ncbi:hypothetical protein [Geomesophilobacter sediminis]|uniref:DUF5683 domain-containing protein n=1 Tax=Geomesophilobacter sediminis TaxID=2798584 RepID=A0A8J7M0L1_9BACT|nr:hypothetical protein [Geomesophilobacter sediminis]MBJ6725757.1 hypothetical protein [Geomesophilobacter sediminis]
MNRKVKAIVLSAFVLPGLGQLVLGRKVKGGIMILLDNIFILGALFVALRAMGKLMLAGRSSAPDPEKILQAIQQDSPAARWLLAGFIVVWLYGIVDAVLDKETVNTH